MLTLRTFLSRRQPVVVSVENTVYLAEAMVHQTIGLEETDDGVRAIDRHTVLRAIVDERA